MMFRPFHQTSNLESQHNPGPPYYPSPRARSLSKPSPSTKQGERTCSERGVTSDGCGMRRGRVAKVRQVQPVLTTGKTEKELNRT